ncbi:ubiquinol-cytochrome c reductase complex 14 kDa protein [Penicillium chermesinum]|uniref:Cytochrome b-c1 complex subunit 7 n=1 Tax=Penicillium chermesinum TaxID=63820 RepID=A0A9W9P6I7_9EURO|nr:ubiquinol-cytochrome c reductase complex 14 kDa protein [Penicillium chermesinum]KAJ5238560.1 ubiquinol-cytochrome c reductase complex 14 kDa protein [Penicillium chermesinum]
MSAPSITNYIVKRPWLKRWMTPLAQWYTDAAGYRRIGLKADDLIPEESEVVQTAIKRLPPQGGLRPCLPYSPRIPGSSPTPFTCSISHTLLPAEEQIKPHEDVEYLSPIIREIEAANKEREDLDHLTVRK